MNINGGKTYPNKPSSYNARAFWRYYLIGIVFFQCFILCLLGGGRSWWRCVSCFYSCSSRVSCFYSWFSRVSLLTEQTEPEPAGSSGSDRANSRGLRSVCRLHLFPLKPLFLTTDLSTLVSFFQLNFSASNMQTMRSGGSQEMSSTYLGWPIAPPVYEPKCGGRGLRGLSQWVQLCTWSINKLWRSYFIVNLFTPCAKWN